MKKLIIAIDFDGTIFEQKYPEIGEIKDNAKEVIGRLKRKGHKIIIWTNRSNRRIKPDGGLHRDLDDAREALYFHEIKYDAINSNVPGTFGCTPKIYADVFIDDRNIGGIPSWLEIEKIIDRVSSDPYNSEIGDVFEEKRKARGIVTEFADKTLNCSVDCAWHPYPDLCEKYYCDPKDRADGKNIYYKRS